MIDPFGRTINYLRVSVTDRCDLRCVYCMAEDMTFLPKREILSLEELDRLLGAFIALGVRKLRLTGGEPFLRQDLGQLLQGICELQPTHFPRLQNPGATDQECRCTQRDFFVFRHMANCLKCFAHNAS